MPQFHETGYGQGFFRGQLPALINSLKTIGEELKRSNDLKEKNNTSNIQPNLYILEVMPNLQLSELQAMTEKNVMIVNMDLSKNLLFVQSSLTESDMKTFDFITSIEKN